MKLQIKKGSTDVSVYVFILDSSETTGLGKTGLVYNTSNLVCYYVRPLAAAAAITLATQTVTGAHSDGGFVEVDATNMPGIYRLDLPDVVCASGVNSVALTLGGAADMGPVSLEIQLVAYDPNDAASLGLTGVAADMVKVSGDSVAADNFETMLDGTGGQTLSLGRFVVASSGNDTAFSITGSGTGHGAVITSGSGATGDALRLISASTNGNGLVLDGTGTGSGLLADTVLINGGTATVPSLLVQNTTAGGMAARFRANNGTEDFYLNIADMGANAGVYTYGTVNSGTNSSRLELAGANGSNVYGLKAYGAFGSKYSSLVTSFLATDRVLGISTESYDGAWYAGIDIAVAADGSDEAHACYGYSGGGSTYAGFRLGRTTATGGFSDIYGSNVAGTTDYRVVLGSGNSTFPSVGSVVLAEYSGSYGYGSLLGKNLTFSGNVSVAGTTTLTGAFTATNASNDIRLGATERTNIADALLKRDLDNVEATTAIHSLASAALKLVSKFDALTGITYRTDGTTTHMTQTPTTDATMVPIRSLDMGV